MPAALAAKVAALPLEELAAFVRALPRLALLSVMALADDQLWSERLAHAPAPVVITAATAAAPGEILTADEAAAYLRISRDTLYAQVARGELAPLPRPRGGRIRFRRRDLETAAWLANGVAPRYMPPHDTPRRPNAPPAPRLDATGARPRPRCDGDDRRPLGTRGAHRHAPSRSEPWAPGQAAWQGPPKPDGGGA